VVQIQAQAGDEQSIRQPEQSDQVATELDASESGRPYFDDHRPKRHSVAATTAVRFEPIEQSAV
jgi:hypothetical protein